MSQGIRGERGEPGKRGRLPRRIELSFWLVVLVAFVVVAGLSWVIADNRRLARDGKQAHDALCVYKGDLGRRLTDSRAFVEDPPKTIFGIPVTAEVMAQATAQVKNQEATFDSLSELDCA